MIGRLAFAVALLVLQIHPALAHEIQHAVETTTAIAVRLTYADGKPLALAAYEAYPDGKDVPAHTGRTDEQGRAVFLPGDMTRWRIKAFSRDGHGVDIRIDVPPVAASPHEQEHAEGPNRASVLLLGVSALLALFGVYQLWLRKKPQ